MKKIGIFIAVITVFFGCKKQDISRLQDHFTLRNQGADMPIWVEGNLNSNAMVIFVHGGPGGDGQIYNTYLQEFSDKMESEFAMVYWDQRASGNSTGNFNSSKYNVETYVADLEKLIDVLKLRYGNARSIFILGHSWGGTLITAYAIDASRQAKIKGFIEVDGAHDFKSVDVLVNRFKQIGNEQILLGNHVTEWNDIVDYCNQVDPNNATDEQITKLNGYGFTAEQYLVNAGFIVNESGTVNIPKYQFNGSLHFPLSWWNSTITNKGMYNELKNADYTAQMNAIKIPSLFLWGRWDMVVPRASGISGFVSCGAADKKYKEFDQSGHSPMINQMQDFVNELVPWVKARK